MLTGVESYLTLTDVVVFSFTSNFSDAFGFTENATDFGSTTLGLSVFMVVPDGPLDSSGF